MGSTITSGRIAAAVQTHDDRTLFVLFEETCCSNVSPRTPSWSCVGIGYLPAVLKLIFEIGSVCEGGMLRSRSGRLTPEGYIATWLKQLANPLHMTKTTVRIAATAGYAPTIDYKYLSQAMGILNDAGLPNQAIELLHEHTIMLDLVYDADAVLALQDGLALSPWRLIDGSAIAHQSWTRTARVGYRPQPGKSPILEQPAALRLNNDVRLLKDEHGAWRCGGWQYSLVCCFIRDLWRAELECPGHHRKQITSFRSGLEHGQAAPPEMTVEITTIGVDDACTKKKLAKLQHQHGNTSPIFRVPLTAETEYALSTLPSSCAEWLMPDGFSETTTVQAAFAV